MKQIIITIIIFLNCLYSNATIQIPDQIIYKGDTVYIRGLPLEHYFYNKDKPNFSEISKCRSSGCWRGYKSLWEIKDNRLVLNSIYSCCSSTDFLIREQDVQTLQTKLPDEVFLIVKQYINQRIDSRALYQILNDASENKPWESKYGYLFINTIRENCLQITVENELAIKDKLFTNEEIIFATWYTGELIFDYGQIVEKFDYSYIPQREYTVLLKFNNGEIINQTIVENNNK